MKFNKSLTMIPLVVSISANSFASNNTNFMYNEDDLKNNLIHINQNIINDTKRDDSFIFDTQYIRIRLYDYLEKWHSETELLSNVNKITRNENFKKIVSLGIKAVPDIIEEIHLRPSNLVWALNHILGFKISNSPLSIEEACRAWVRWGINNEKY